MNYLDLFFIAISLSIDAFAVSVSNGILLKNINIYCILKFSLFFGFFQFIMPIIGYYSTSFLGENILKFNHWITFLLLNLMGIKMIVETFKKNTYNVYKKDNILSIKNLTVLAIAVSIDALAIGVSLFMFKYNIILSSITIGIITFVFSAIGIILGKNLNNLLCKNVERIAGISLIAISFKILIENL